MHSLINMLMAGSLVTCVFKETLYSSIPDGLKPAVVLRSCTQVIGFIGFATANKILPLSVWFVVFSSNIFSTAILGRCWLKEILEPFEIVCMIFAFTGIIIIGLSGGEEE